MSPRIIHIYGNKSGGWGNRKPSSIEEISEKIRKLGYVKDSLSLNLQSKTDAINRYMREKDLTLMPSVKELHDKYHVLSIMERDQILLTKELGRIELRIILLGKERKRLQGRGDE